MREIGVRELRATLSRTLREVSRGGRVRVTAHGRPLADIVPAGAADADERIAALVAAGRITPATREQGTAPPLAKAARSATEIVLRERDLDR